MITTEFYRPRSALHGTPYGGKTRRSIGLVVFNFLNFMSFVVNIVYFADIQLNPEKPKNR